MSVPPWQVVAVILATICPLTTPQTAADVRVVDSRNGDTFPEYHAVTPLDPLSR
jgi:hypothetical protein